MGVLALRETPRCLEVFGEVLGLLDALDHSLVDVLLVGRLGFGEGLLLLGLALREELLLRGAGTLGRGLREVGIVDLLVDLPVTSVVSVSTTSLVSLQHTLKSPRSTLVEVAITYAWFTLRRGTPFTL